MEQYINRAAVVAEIERRMKLRQDSYRKYNGVSDFVAFEELEYLHDEFLPTLEVKEVQEESVSKDLEEAAFDYAEACKYDGGEKLLCVEHFKDGAKWQALHSLETIKGMEEQAFLAGVEAEQINKSFSKEELLNRWINKL